ncbi:hypothetical protein HMPREF0322_01484, partial [Desulfitobacterium hafniense DP7]
MPPKFLLTVIIYASYGILQIKFLPYLATRKANEPFATLLPVTNAPAVWAVLISAKPHGHINLLRGAGVRVGPTPKQRDHLNRWSLALPGNDLLS